ncbi:MAG: hypothetical protein J3K34DRAFT_507387 [Monoraphidium minutum]|nr:MAG: hypothetical protein J3K34DRAFT_507387 [Monoraphidium minutum]
MLWSHVLLSQGPLRVAWIAFSRQGGSLSRSQVEAADIQDGAAALLALLPGDAPGRGRKRRQPAGGAAAAGGDDASQQVTPLRVVGPLLNGLAVIYHRKVDFLHRDALRVEAALRTLGRPRRVEELHAHMLPDGRNVAPAEAITLDALGAGGGGAPRPGGGGFSATVDDDVAAALALAHDVALFEDALLEGAAAGSLGPGRRGSLGLEALRPAGAGGGGERPSLAEVAAGALGVRRGRAGGADRLWAPLGGSSEDATIFEEDLLPPPLDAAALDAAVAAPTTDAAAGREGGGDGVGAAGDEDALGLGRPAWETAAGGGVAAGEEAWHEGAPGEEAEWGAGGGGGAWAAAEEGGGGGGAPDAGRSGAGRARLARGFTDDGEAEGGGEGGGAARRRLELGGEGPLPEGAAGDAAAEAAGGAAGAAAEALPSEDGEAAAEGGAAAGGRAKGAGAAAATGGGAPRPRPRRRRAAVVVDAKDGLPATLLRVDEVRALQRDRSTLLKDRSAAPLARGGGASAPDGGQLSLQPPLRGCEPAGAGRDESEGGATSDSDLGRAEAAEVWGVGLPGGRVWLAPGGGGGSGGGGGGGGAPLLLPRWMTSEARRALFAPRRPRRRGAGGAEGGTAAAAEGHEGGEEGAAAAKRPRREDAAAAAPAAPEEATGDAAAAEAREEGGAEGPGWDEHAGAPPPLEEGDLEDGAAAAAAAEAEGEARGAQGGWEALEGEMLEETEPSQAFAFGSLGGSDAAAAAAAAGARAGELVAAVASAARAAAAATEGAEAPDGAAAAAARAPVELALLLAGGPPRDRRLRAARLFAAAMEAGVREMVRLRQDAPYGPVLVTLVEV